MSVENFVKQRGSRRHVVSFKGKRLALPAVWTKERWDKLSKKEQLYIFRACTDLKFFMLHCFLPFVSEVEGEECPTKLPPHMIEFLDQVQPRIPAELLPFDHEPNARTFRLCIIMPTGVMKSLMCGCIESWLIGLNPNISIVKVTSVATLGERFVSLHSDIIHNSESYIFTFGDLDPKSTHASRTWRNDAIEVERPLPRATPTYMAVGYGGSFEGTRFDIAMVDDITDFQNSKTEEARSMQAIWISQVLEKRLHPRRRLMLVVGTVHHRTDVYHRYAEQSKTTGTWDFIGRTMIPQSAIDAGLWPPKKKNPSLPYSMDNVIIPYNLPTLWDFWKPEVLVSEYIDNPHAFARTRQNQIQDEDSAMFSPQMLDFCLANGELDPSGKKKPDLCFWNSQDGIPQAGSPIYEIYQKAGIDIEYGVVTCDLAATDKKPGQDPDWCCFMFFGWCRNTRRRILLDMVRFRTGNPKIVKRRLADFVRGYLPIIRKVAAEANAVDKLFVGELSDFLREEMGTHVAVMSLRGEKAELIESFKDLLGDPGVWIPYSKTSQRTRALVNVFREELLDYPNGKHDDTLITAVHHIRLLKAGGVSSGGAVHVMGNGEDEVAEADLGGPPTDEKRWDHVLSQREKSKNQRGAGSPWARSAELRIGSFR